MPTEGKPPVPDSILALVERYGYNSDAYESPNYNETQARREFIDPFFEALGWDIDNQQGYAEAYKDVIHEDSIRVGEATKAPDYCFRIGELANSFSKRKSLRSISRTTSIQHFSFAVMPGRPSSLLVF